MPLLIAITDPEGPFQAVALGKPVDMYITPRQLVFKFLNPEDLSRIDRLEVPWTQIEKFSHSRYNSKRKLTVRFTRAQQTKHYRVQQYYPFRELMITSFHMRDYFLEQLKFAHVLTDNMQRQSLWTTSFYLQHSNSRQIWTDRIMKERARKCPVICNYSIPSSSSSTSALHTPSSSSSSTTPSSSNINSNRTVSKNSNNIYDNIFG